MKVNEIFLSVQGEGKFTGYPTIFIRLTGCNLRCLYCDTKYSYFEGNELTENEILDLVNSYGYKRVCITGGEPLEQNIKYLLEGLKDFCVTIETNGSILLNRDILYEKHTYVMDLKTPSSGCGNSNNFQNFEELSSEDEIKVVIGSKRDYDWALKILKKYYKLGNIIFSPVYDKLDYKLLVEWILKDKLDVRFQIQLHKVIWDMEQRGV